MTVSSASNGTGSSGSSAARSSVPVPPTTLPSSGSSTAMRTFAAIRCSSCQYLEFPGCDVHGVLYTERVTLTGASASAGDGAPSTPPLHAKCPNCTAATHNVRPFRDGCRRCKAPTTVHMWTSSPRELSRAHAAFPVAAGDEIAHSVLLCDACGSAVFPRARDELTTRTARDPILATGGRALQVANFQLSMPHLDGCPRRGMPVRAVAVRLPRSELQFVRDRIEQCPLAPAVDGAPQYRPRCVTAVGQQNHLDQVMLRMLITVMTAFDPKSPAAIQPLQQIVSLVNQLEPLSLFSDWAPPRRLSQVIVSPSRITASSELDKQHSPMRILEPNAGLWISAPPKADSVGHDEWLEFEFTTPLTVSSVTLRWHPDKAPSHFSVSVSTDGTSFSTVAIVTERSATSRVAIPMGAGIKSVKVMLFSSISKDGSFGLEAVDFREALEDTLYTPESVLLAKLQDWVLHASVSSDSPIARDLSLQAAQKLALATGSLCGLLTLASMLILHSVPNSVADSAFTKYDDQTWKRMDALSETAQQFSQRFLLDLCKSITKILDEEKIASTEEVLANPKRLPPISNESGGTSATDRQVLASASASAELPPPLPLTVAGADKTVGSTHRMHKTSDADEISPKRLISLLTVQPQLLASVKRRSQLGVMIIYILGELAGWEMQRMQKVEGALVGSGKHTHDLTALESPFSMEIRHEFFDVSHQLLRRVLARWLKHSSVDDDEIKPEVDNSDSMKSNDPTANGATTHDAYLYDTLLESLAELNSITSTDILPLTPTGGGAASTSLKPPTFSPDKTCVALLQVVTANIRRLVLSRVDPWDIEGSQTGSSARSDPSKVDGDLLAAPPALQPMVSSLEKLIGLGSKRSDKFFPVSLKAAAAVEVGLEAFYPSALQRTRLLTSRMGKGATLEVQVRWPVQERDQEDPRYERLMLMLQFECIRMGWQHAMRGSWRFFMHLIVQIPATTDSELALTQHFAPCIHRAGFSTWLVTAGAQEMSISLQRHLHWNRVEKMCQEAGVGWIRVYPRDVAGFEEVLTDVEGFLTDQAAPDGPPLRAP